MQTVENIFCALGALLLICSVIWAIGRWIFGDTSDPNARNQ